MMLPINTMANDGFIYDACREYMTHAGKQWNQNWANWLQRLHHRPLSSQTTAPYPGLTVHFLNKDFELKTQCLLTAYYPSEHTRENTVCGLCEALAIWHLPAEQLICITNNRTSIVKGTELNHWVRLQCFGYRLHLAIGKCQFDLNGIIVMVIRCPSFNLGVKSHNKIKYGHPNCYLWLSYFVSQTDWCLF